MIEAALVIGYDGNVLHEHLPPGRSPVEIPDSPELWHDVLWPRRGEIAGIAHSHPGDGVPSPSSDDTSTFSAIERALGRGLLWWIATRDSLAAFLWVGPGKYDYDRASVIDEHPSWLPRLRELSAMPWDLVSEARDFALRAHGNQFYGSEPYSVHLDAVAGVLREFGHDSAQALVGAYLHDVLEDTDASVRDIEEQFGADALSIVAFCTDDLGANRRERKAATYSRMRRVLDEDVRLHGVLPAWLRDAVHVKVADRIANLRACLTSANTSLLVMYRREARDFREALYVAGICDSLWVEYDRLVSAS